MTAREQDEARDAAWREYMARYGYDTLTTSPDTGADFAAGWDARNAEVELLTAQLQAAQATIAEAARGLRVYPERSYAASVLSRADTSALAAVKARVLDEYAEEQYGPGRAGHYMSDDELSLRERAAEYRGEGN